MGVSLLSCHPQSPPTVGCSCSPGKHKMASMRQEARCWRSHMGSLEGGVKTPRAQLPVGEETPATRDPTPSTTASSDPTVPSAGASWQACVVVEWASSAHFPCPQEAFTSLPTKQHKCRVFPQHLLLSPTYMAWDRSVMSIPLGNESHLSLHASTQNLHRWESRSPPIHLGLREGKGHHPARQGAQGSSRAEH